MSLSNEQYDQILRGYERRRDRNRLLTEEKRKKIDELLPGLKALEKRIATLSVQEAMQEMDGNEERADEIHEEILWIRTKRKEELENAGFSELDLEPVYTCPDCRDTGYLVSSSSEEGGFREKCHCFRDQEMTILYDQSNIRQQLERDNFSSLSYNHREGEDLDRLRSAVDLSLSFVQNFEQDYRNLVFYGTVGTGKSFLSCCIASEVLKKYHSVLYLSSQRMFDLLAQYSFSTNSNDRLEKAAFTKDLYSCDLLILDDLGTELSNSFVASQLFTCINERHLRRKATVISTNLSLQEIRDRYSDRVLSRLTGSYQFIQLTGPDIRMLKK